MIFLFGEVGGHAATGSRIGDKITGKQLSEDSALGAGKPSENSVNTLRIDSKSIGKSAQFTINDKVLVLWSGSWYKAQILEYKTPKYLVRYEGWGSLYDEWVTADRIKNQK